MNTLWLALGGAWNVLWVGLLLGAGLPAIFALGIRALSYGVGGDADATDHVPHPAARVVAYLCFAVVLVAVTAGIGVIVAHGLGMRLVMDGLLPSFVAK
ncbi:hypothetical protein H5398_07905 [Tessaracoccus sp. MC1679]|uniref:hypothetical protein n=1 Tax=unclassified Tessaracoccus TaxID=2635419 RepID=UPI0016044571|nr:MULTISPECIES: hypothetical protein [unclassified Tessaracoccus]MBB1513015.1 hypothetical protein [Tessaracoccus sp. MC1627]MBB1515891.1 hypothetical protein [Tessaracoccus sp. MC1679]